MNSKSNQIIRPAKTPFLRLDATVGWRRLKMESSNDIFVDAASGALRLGDENTTAIRLTEPAGSFGGLTRPTGLAVGEHGRLFLADPERNRILTYTVAAQSPEPVSGGARLRQAQPASKNEPIAHKAFEPLWEQPAPPPPSQHSLIEETESRGPTDAYHLNKPRGVAISREGDLVVADSGHGRIIIYTWPGLVARHIITLPTAVTTNDGDMNIQSQPWDIAYDAQGYLYVADVGADRVYRFDRLWRLDERYNGQLKRPKHLAIDSQDCLFVLSEANRQVFVLDDVGNAQEIDVGNAQEINDAKLYQRSFPLPLQLGEGGLLHLRQEDQPNCPTLPLKGITLDRNGAVTGTGVLLLPRPKGVIYPEYGRYISEALDSNIFNCTWHRLVLDAEIPAETSLTIRTFTAPTLLDSRQIEKLSIERWSRPLTITSDHPHEVLFQSGPGRYLWLRVDFQSSGQATPRIRSMLVYAPRQSSLNYLPPVFHEDPVSTHFLDRFLAYFDTVFEEIESQIQRFSSYLDPDGVPAGEFLDWLGSWFDLVFLNEWSDTTRREFIRRAISLYRKRGTVSGIQEILRLHTGLQPPLPMLIEHFRLDPSNAENGQSNAIPSLLGGLPFLEGIEYAYHFTVVLPSQSVPDEEAKTTIRRLVDAQKPAHTRYRLFVIEPGLRIGDQSTIGLDTFLSSYPTAPLGQMNLSQSSMLSPIERSYNQIGQSRLSD